MPLFLVLFISLLQPKKVWQPHLKSDILYKDLQMYFHPVKDFPDQVPTLHPNAPIYYI